MYSVGIQENTDQEKLRIWTLFMQRIFVLNKVSFHNNTVRFEHNSVSLHHYFIITQFGSNIIQLVSMFAKGKCRFESRAMKRAEKKQKVEAVTANTKSVGSFFKKSFNSDTVENTMTSVLSSSEFQAKMTD